MSRRKSDPQQAIQALYRELTTDQRTAFRGYLAGFEDGVGQSGGETRSETREPRRGRPKTNGIPHGELPVPAN